MNKEKQTRTRFVGVRFTPDELEYIRSHAEFKKLSLATFIRMIVAEKLNEENNIKRG